MSFNIPLAKDSLLAIKAVNPGFNPLIDNEKISISQLAALIKSTDTKHAAINALLIKDLTHALLALDNQPKKIEDDQKFKIGLLSFLGFAGLVNYLIWGFDGVFSIMQMFTASPLLLYLPGILFAFIAGLVFISFDFYQAANELGVDFFDFSTEVNDFIEEEAYLIQLLENIDYAFLQQWALSDNEKIILIQILEEEVNRLNQIRRQLMTVKESSFSLFMQQLSCGLCGFMYFFDGFFCGQAGAMFLLGVSSLGAGLATPFGAVLMLGLGIVSAIGAASFYFLIQKKSVEYLVSAVFGINKEKVEEFILPEKSERLEKVLGFKKQFVAEQLALKTVSNDGLCQNKYSAKQKEHNYSNLAFFPKPRLEKKEGVGQLLFRANSI